MERAGEILKGILKETRIREGEKYVSLFRGWSDLVGEPLSAHTKVADIHGQHLMVEIDHPGWFQMFKFKERQILKVIRNNYPELDILTIKVRVVSRTNEPSIRPSGTEGIKEKEDKSDSGTGKISDYELREALDGLYRRIMDKNQ